MTVRISGQVTDTNVHLGDGNDSLLVDGSSERFYVNGEQGRDYIELRFRQRCDYSSRR